MVMVPEEGEKFAPAPTVSEPITSKLLDVVTVADGAIAKGQKLQGP